ncbi:hypothetical protein KIL84_008149 [Mauremys mutica]|uniref:Uncharacterized protein n=1 Tax=Mauremys mutica TaxID=74926 RepID=A0A9D3WQF0_9SAUR|nr:hypothetical protein KIL84_008149 [Mauremys mutica]
MLCIPRFHTSILPILLYDFGATVSNYLLNQLSDKLCFPSQHLCLRSRTDVLWHFRLKTRNLQLLANNRHSSRIRPTEKSTLLAIDIVVQNTGHLLYTATGMPLLETHTPQILKIYFFLLLVFHQKLFAN